MKRKYGVAFCVAAFTLAVASVAWACTPRNGRTFLTSPNGCELTAPNCTVKAGNNAYIAAHAEGMARDTSTFGNFYKLYFSSPPWCHASIYNVVLHPSIELQANPDGRLPIATQIDPTTGQAYQQRDTLADGSLEDTGTGQVDVWANIPRDISLKGTHDVCFNNSGGTDPNNESNSSYPQSLTIT